MSRCGFRKNQLFNQGFASVIDRLPERVVAAGARSHFVNNRSITDPPGDALRVSRWRPRKRMADDERVDWFGVPHGPGGTG
jgi:hypothetical protein